MRWFGLFIMRPVATTLACLAMVLAGGLIREIAESS